MVKKEIKDKHRRILLDFHTPSWPEGVFKDLNTDELFNIYKYAGVEVAMCSMKCCYGYNYYNTVTGIKHPGLGNRDLLAEYLESSKKTGIDVIVYLVIAFDYHVGKLHPDWIQVDIEGEKCIYNEHGHSPWKMMCVNTGYGDYFYNLISEILEYDGLKGIYLDMLNFHFPKLSCFCPSCREIYSSETGNTVPELIDWDDQGFIDFIRWRYKNLENYKKHIRNLIKERNKDLLFSCNYHGKAGAGKWQDSYLGGQTAEGGTNYNDYTYAEAYSDIFGYSYPALLPKWIRNASGGKDVECLTYRFLVDGWDFAVRPKEMMKYELATFAANGANVGIVDQLYSGGKFEPKVYENLKFAYDDIKAREEYLYGKEPLHYLGIYFSQNTKDFYARDNKNKYEPGFLGACQIASDLHLPWEIIFDRTLNEEDLHKYKIIYIPNGVCLSDKQIEIFKEYVKNGGSILATYMTSLADSNGKPREDFGLSELFGNNYSGTSEFREGYISIQQASDIWDSNIDYPMVIRNNPINFKSILSKNNILAKLMLPVGKKTDTRFYSHNVIPPDLSKKTNIPIITRNYYGKGSVIYIGANIEEDYMRYGYPFDRSIIKNIITNAFKELPIVRITAPLSVEAVFTEEEDKYIVNLINFHSNRRFEMGSNENKMLVPVMEEVIPIYNIDIETLFNIKNAYSVPSGNNIADIKNTKKGGRFYIKKTDLWETIVIEKG